MVVQIETAEAVTAAAEIAAVEGVDVLFVEPLDLSVSLGCPGDFGHPRLLEAMRHVVQSCEVSGNVPGILTQPGFEQQHKDLGLRFIPSGSDSGAIVQAMKSNLESLR